MLWCRRSTHCCFVGRRSISKLDYQNLSRGHMASVQGCDGFFPQALWSGKSQTHTPLICHCCSSECTAPVWDRLERRAPISSPLLPAQSQSTYLPAQSPLKDSKVPCKVNQLCSLVDTNLTNSDHTGHTALQGLSHANGQEVEETHNQPSLVAGYEMQV